MNIRNFIVPLTLALITTWVIQYFVINPYLSPSNAQGEHKSGQTFVAPQSKIAAQPLNKEIDFLDNEPLQDALETSIETDHASYIFSTHGACLKQLTFKRVMNEKPVLLSTMPSVLPAQKETRSFLLAFEQKTPFNYELVQKVQQENSTRLHYKAETDQGTVEKLFTIHHAKFQVDLDLTITPKSEPLRARIFYTAPYMPEIKEDTIAALYTTQKGAVQKELRTKLDLNKGWYLPGIFGSENRYFIHALVADGNQFAQRAYYDLRGQQDLISILESEAITAPTTYTLSFYLGPKEEKAIQSVDVRLEQALDYSGWLAPLSKVLLLLLKYLYSFLHNYGWAIVVLTILINLILLPLNIKSAQSMKKYTEFQKKLVYIQQRYKDDPDTLARERTELMSKHGMTGLGGCLPKLLQLPIFFALSKVLSSSIELYKAPFILWIQDLSARDPYFILPILIGFSMILVSSSADPKQRFAMIAVALIFGTFAVNFSAGLCLYILVGIVLTGLQTLLQTSAFWSRTKWS